MGTTRSGVVRLAAAVFTLAAAFFFDFPAAGLFAAVDLGSGFLGRAVFLVAVILGCLDTSVNDWVVGFGLGFGGIGDLDNTPPERRSSSPRLGPSRRQRVRPAEFSERQVGLWLHS